MSSKTHLTIHLILCVKYRKHLLSKLGVDINQLVFDASKNKFNVTHMEVDKDHIHIMIDYPPSISVGYIVKVIKSYTTTHIWKSHIWKSHKQYLKKHFWKKHIFWSSGYFACSVGDASRDTIAKYIQEQG